MKYAIYVYIILWGSRKTTFPLPFSFGWLLWRGLSIWFCL